MLHKIIYTIDIQMNKVIRSILLLIMIVAVTACPSSRNDMKEDAEEQSRPRSMPRKSLAPETVQVSAALIEYKDNDSFYSCIIKLDKVLAYGSAISPLAEGSELQVEIAKDLIINKFAKIETMLESDRLFTMTIRKNKGGLGIDMPEKHSWSVIKID
jgi:hypothetical protein